MSAKKAILVAISSSSFVLLLPTMISGLIPNPCNSFTECWVGFVFCSHTAPTTGTNVV